MIWEAHLWFFCNYIFFQTLAFRGTPWKSVLGTDAPTVCIYIYINFTYFLTLAFPGTPTKPVIWTCFISVKVPSLSKEGQSGRQTNQDFFHQERHFFLLLSVELTARQGLTNPFVRIWSQITQPFKLPQKLNGLTLR